MCESFQRKDESILNPLIIRRAALDTSATGHPPPAFPGNSVHQPPAAPRIGYNALMTLKDRIAAAAAEVRRKGGHPRQVHLRPDDAIQLQYELLAEGGEVGHAIMQGGVGKAVSSVFGLQIVWKSAQFSVA
jgi:hypothetical protein